jgi:hypothetical protein
MYVATHDFVQVHVFDLQGSSIVLNHERNHTTRYTIGFVLGQTRVSVRFLPCDGVEILGRWMD